MNLKPRKNDHPVVLRSHCFGPPLSRLSPTFRAVILALSMAATGCRSGAESTRHSVAGDDAAATISSRLGDVRLGGVRLGDVRLGDVIDGWGWARATGATDRDKVLEDIGPYEPRRDGGAGRALVNTNADYWTRLVGIPWTRDVELVLHDQPIDLDGDHVADTTVSRRVSARGGVLDNPELFGLTRTPEDPRGRVGKISASTGVLGLREALGADGRPSGQIGMTCLACHGARDPIDGRITFGLPARAFDYGLLLATAAVLDERNDTSAAHRRAKQFPPGQTVRARLLMAGPGRQDLTGEFGLDVTIPGVHSAHYPGAARVRQGTSGLVNPVSVPGILAAPGLLRQNWSGSENSAGPWLERLIALAQQPEANVLATFDLPPGDRAVARRALLLDLRNLGTLGLQQDSWPGLLWADALYGRATVSAADMARIPPLYAAQAVRRVLAQDIAALRRPPGDPQKIARGRALFSDRVIGSVTNRQILKTAPPAYAAAKLDSAVGVAIVAPIDPSLPLAAKLPVRCADCHSGAPLDTKRSLAENPPPLGRCTHCHTAHPDQTKAGADTEAPAPVSIRSLAPPPAAPAEVAFCTQCHTRHRDFGPLVYSSSRLLPFDADADGNAQGDEAEDARAGGIGTESWLAFDVPRAERPGGRFSVALPIITNPRQPGPVTRAPSGVPWVRVAPLLALFASAPYLHNGSVPTLRALLEPAARRPVTFALGSAGFVFDTRLPGNRNIGHEYGTRLSPREKDDLVAFLSSL